MPCTVAAVHTGSRYTGDDGYRLTAAGAYLYTRVLTRALLKRLHIPNHETEPL